MIRQAGNDVRYREILPAAALAPFIHCYWELETIRPLKTPFNYRVVADGCIDIFFELQQPQENFVMGFCNQYTEFRLEHSFHYIGIRFLPTMFPQLFPVNAAELSNRFEDLRAVVPSMAGFIADNIHPDHDLEQISAMLNIHLGRLTEDRSFNADGRLYEAIRIILQHEGTLSTEKMLDTGISPRQLRRLFEYYIGDTPKTFSKVVRFQNSLRKGAGSFDAGYYDQSHFIKDFKTFYGATPRQAQQDR
ncbi:helix-turn-helix domain-containing protein [Chitinophaga sp. XS-30]|uniref:AraC family transcriptional regulator n=1 Tax=Chitinophaga sp. XS-30 TaxID=2604421 RepID=UPI001AEFCD78|nr:helix-turn-helix domain-containing protein [Chitinophaga sp. XS-30]